MTHSTIHTPTVSLTTTRATCLVTGGSGFTGRHLIARLRQQGHRVVALASCDAGAHRHHHIALDDREGLAKVVRAEVPDRVFHLAALSFVGHPEPLDFYAVNVLGGQHLLEACAALDAPPRVLFASSANVYGANASGRVNEQVPPAPVNHYAASKLAAEHMARTFAHRVPLLLARPFNYTGPGQAGKFLIPKMVEHFRRRAEHIELGNLEVKRDFSDVRDIVIAYAELLANWPAEAQSGDVVNLGRGDAIALTEVLAMLEAQSGHHMAVEVNPAFVRANEIPELKADISRLAGWCTSYAPRPLADTLNDMLSYATSPSV